MTKFIVHIGTGTIIDASDDVYIFDTDTLTESERERLTGDDYFDDQLICGLAEEIGTKLSPELLEMTYGNTVSFSPTALRIEVQESETLREELGEDNTAWVLSDATAEDFSFIAGVALGDDRMWSEYTLTVANAIITAHSVKDVK